MFCLVDTNWFLYNWHKGMSHVEVRREFYCLTRNWVAHIGRCSRSLWSNAAASGCHFQDCSARIDGTDETSWRNSSNY